MRPLNSFTNSILKFAFIFTLVATLPNLILAQNLDSKEGDYQALQALYSSTDGSNWDDNTGWKSISPSTMGDAVGIEVNSNGRVITIDMQTVTSDSYSKCAGNNLTGILPPEVGNLKKLEVLKLKTNNLSGKIPSEIGNLRSLRWLALGGQRCNVDLANHQWNENNHTGSPNKHGKQWEETNSFSGPIPPEIGSLSNLELLEIRRQHLTGTIPPEIGKLSNLVGLFLNDQKGQNPLGGKLPPEMGRLKKLKHLHLDSRSNDAPAFSGEIPSEINEGLTELRHVRLRDNNFTGPIPTFPNCNDLRIYSVPHNNFTGEFPVEIFDGSNGSLNNFAISGNNLTGQLPTNPNSRDNYNSMSKFNIGGNNFTGPVPDWIQEMAGHQVFDIKNNQLSGSFPEKVMNRQKLKTFLISNNNFSGELPSKRFASSRMLTIYAQSNNFKGEIPDEWASLTKSSNRMLYLYLNNNKLRGNIPAWLAGISGIRRIYLQGNKYTPKDILPTLSQIKATAKDYEYLPQKPFSSSATIPVGEVIDKSSFKYSGNQYQWYKNGKAISGETSSKIDTKDHGEGTYKLEITHPKIDFTFESKKNEVVSNGNNPPMVPSLDSPKNGAQGQATSPSLDWGTSSGAVNYELQVAKDQSFSSKIVDESSLNESRYKVSGLDSSTKYFWRVKAVSSVLKSDWSNVWSFTTDNNSGEGNSLKTPNQISPSDDAETTSQSPKFKWKSVGGADSYILHISAKNPSEMIIEQNIDDTSFIPNNNLDANRAYYWRVRSVKGNTKGKWSSIWKFNTGNSGSGGSSDSTTAISYNKGWNLVSIPRKETDQSFEDLYSNNIISSIYSFEATYTTKSPGEKLSPGKGYWIKLDTDQKVVFEGSSLESLNLSLESGWNLIGGTMNTVNIKTEISDPNNIIKKICQPKEGLSSSCENVTTLKPGSAYFIKAVNSGNISLN